MPHSVDDMTQTLKGPRFPIYKSSPELYDAMMALSTAAAKDVEPELGELIKIRASQMNRCAFCLDMHTRDARKLGVSDQKIDVLAAWTEAGDLFTAREQAALALTESSRSSAITASPRTSTPSQPRRSPSVSSARSSRWPSPSTPGTGSTPRSRPRRPAADPPKKCRWTLRPDAAADEHGGHGCDNHPGDRTVRGAELAAAVGLTLGRLVTTVGGWTEIFPVNYVVQHKTLLFRTAEGTKLLTAVLNENVVFEADDHNVVEGGALWSAEQPSFSTPPPRSPRPNARGCIRG